MASGCGNRDQQRDCGTRAAAAAAACGATGGAGAPRGAGEPLAYFGGMIQHCYQYALEAKLAGRPIVGILCEFTPRELILAAGGVPVCLCGGSANTIAAAEQDLPANLCPLIKSTYGYHVLDSNPFLKMADLVVAETTCDGKKKMYELMARTRPVYVLELPQKVDEAEAGQRWYEEIVKLRGELERRFGVEITECKLRKAIRVMNRERSLRRQLAEGMKAERPALTGRQLLSLKSSVAGNPRDLEQYEKAVNAYGRVSCLGSRVSGTDGGLISGCSDNCSSNEGTAAGEAGTPNGNCQVPGARCQSTTATTTRLKAELQTPAKAGTPNVRVLLTGVPIVHGAERVLDIIEGAGGLVVAMENCTGLKPILEDVDENAADPLRAIAEKYLHLPCSVMTPNTRRMEMLRSLAKEYRAECVVELVWQACLTYDVEARVVRETVEKELGLPYLKIETDYSPSDSARIATRVEALLETARGRA